MKKFICFLVVVGMLMPVISVAASGSSRSYDGGGLRNSGGSNSEQRAISAYNKGLKHRDSAWNLTLQAKDLPAGAKQKKLTKKSQKAYKKAIKSFRKAVQYNPKMYQAYSSLGFALRKTGSLDESLVAYQKSLSINPDYYEAIEYLAETRMQRYEFAEVKIAHARLIKEHPQYAEQLEQAISEWLLSQNLQARVEVQQFAEWFNTVKSA